MQEFLEAFLASDAEDHVGEEQEGMAAGEEPPRGPTTTAALGVTGLATAAAAGAPGLGGAPALSHSAAAGAGVVAWPAGVDAAGLWGGERQGGGWPGQEVAGGSAGWAGPGGKVAADGQSGGGRGMGLDGQEMGSVGASRFGGADDSLFLPWDACSQAPAATGSQRDLADALTLLPDFEQLARNMVAQHGGLTASQAFPFQLDLAAMML